MKRQQRMHQQGTSGKLCLLLVIDNEQILGVPYLVVDADQPWLRLKVLPLFQ